MADDVQLTDEQRAALQQQQQQPSAAVSAPAQGPGRTYIGPASTTGVDANGNMVMQVDRPALSDDDQAALQHRLALATAGPSRVAVAPPDGGGVSMPNISAFSNLPVAQSRAAVEAAEKYQYQRMYLAEVQKLQAAGYSPALASHMAFQTYGPLLMKSGTGASTMTPYQQARTDLAKQRETRLEAPKVLTPAQQIGADRLAFQKTQAAAAGNTETIRAPLDPANPFSGSRTFKQARTNAPAAAVAAPAMSAPAGKALTKDQAKAFLAQAGGNAAKARELAKAAGFHF